MPFFHKHGFSGAAIIRDWLGSGGVPVERDVAQQRADVCSGCKHNNLGISMASVMPVLKKLIEIKNKEHLRVNGEKSLGTCGICHCNIPTKIWTPIEHIENHTTKDEMPESCWISREMNL